MFRDKLLLFILALIAIFDPHIICLLALTPAAAILCVVPLVVTSDQYVFQTQNILSTGNIQHLFRHSVTHCRQQ